MAICGALAAALGGAVVVVEGAVTDACLGAASVVAVEVGADLAACVDGGVVVFGATVVVVLAAAVVVVVEGTGDATVLPAGFVVVGDGVVCTAPAAPGEAIKTNATTHTCVTALVAARKRPKLWALPPNRVLREKLMSRSSQPIAIQPTSLSGPLEVELKEG